MNDFTQNNLAGRGEKEIRAKRDKNNGALYVLNQELKDFLNLASPPARLNTAQTAARLGFKPHDIPVLAARGFLKPLGKPMSNSDKYYARARIQELENDEEWLSRATAVLSQHWQAKNARKKSGGVTIRLHSLAPAAVT